MPMASAQSKPRVLVLGGGSWGTTMASICANNAPTLQWILPAEQDVADDINNNHRNTFYIGEQVALHESLRATTDFDEALGFADVVVLGVPSQAVREVLSGKTADLDSSVPIISLVKGLEQSTNKRMSQIVEEVLPGHPAGILAGPTIAGSVAAGQAAGAVLAMPDEQLSEQFAPVFQTDRFRTYTTDDVLGVEMAGALKNIYAIAIGMGDGLDVGENARALVMTRAVREMGKLGEAMGGDRDTFAGLAGMGDLMVTCTSPNSRNRHVGEQLGLGKSLDEIIEAMNQVAEGVKAVGVINKFADQYSVHMPIARQVDAVINGDSTPQQAYDALFAEHPGHEVHGTGF